MADFPTPDPDRGTPPLTLSRAYLVTTLAAAVLFALCWLRHTRVASMEDLALFDQILWNVRRGAGPWTSISGNIGLLYPHNFMGEHFAPILYLLAWPAALTPGPEALLALQAVAVMAAAVPLAWLGAQGLRSPHGAWVGVLWLAQPALWQAALYDFHMDAFEPFFLFAFVAAFLRGSPVRWLWALLYVACKEDAALYLVVVAGLLGGTTRRRREGFAVAMAALVWAALTLGVAIPWFCPPGQRHLLASRLLTPATTGGVAAWFHAVACDPGRWLALGRHVLAWGALPLLAGVWLFAPAACLGVMWLSSDAYQSHLWLHYPFTFFPLMALASLAGVRRLVAASAAWGRMRRFAMIGMALAVVAGGIATAWIAAFPAIDAVLGGLGPDGPREARATLGRIPAGAGVTAALTLTPHLARRADLRLMVNPTANTEWLATRTDNTVYPCPADDHWTWLTESLLAPGSPYGLVAADECIAVFRRGAPTAPNAALRDQLLQRNEAEDSCRLSGRTVRDHAALNGVAVRARRDEPNNYLVFGQYRTLAPGHYVFSFRARWHGPDQLPFACFDVAEDTGRRVCGNVELTGRADAYRTVDLHARLVSGRDVEARVLKTGPGEIVVDRIAWRRVEKAATAP